MFIYGLVSSNKTRPLPALSYIIELHNIIWFWCCYAISSNNLRCNKRPGLYI